MDSDVIPLALQQPPRLITRPTAKGVSKREGRATAPSCCFPSSTASFQLSGQPLRPYRHGCWPVSNDMDYLPHYRRLRAAATQLSQCWGQGGHGCH